MKEFLAKKSKGWYLFAVSAFCALLFLIIYAVRGGDIFTKVQPIAVALLIIGIILNCGLLYKDIKPLEIVPFILYFTALLIYIGSEIEFFGNVAYGTDGQSLDGGLICSLALGLIAVVTGMVASIMKLEK